MSYLENVPLTQLAPHPHNIRRDLGDLTELADSIKGMGLLEPLVVAPKGKPGEGFVVIGGHRRLAAAKEAGIAGVPCILRPDLCTPASQIEAMLTENLQRTDLTVMEEADAYAQLELLGVKDAAICKATGRAPKTVRERRLLATLPTPRREEFEKGLLSLEGAVKCAKLREQWADDAEILAAIDGQGTWAFGSGPYGIDRTIERILDSRKPKPEPEATEDDEDGLDLDGRRAEWEERQRLRDEHAEAVAVVKDRLGEWLNEHLSDEAVQIGLVRWAVEQALADYSVDSALGVLGIDPCGEDEDDGDALSRQTRALAAETPERRVLFLALAVTDAVQPVTAWAWPRKASDFVDYLGYEPSPEEAALLTVEEES